MNGHQPPPVETIGAANHNLVTPCHEGQRQAHDPTRKERSYIALAFSGGGWRAALAAAGVLRFVCEAGLLPRVRWVSSVSGGSVLNGLLAVSRERIAAADFAPEALDAEVIAPLLGAARERSLAMALLRGAWRAPWRTRTGVLADQLAKWLGLGVPLADLDQSCSHVFNAANETTGVRFNFDAQRIGDYVIGFRETAGTPMRVADAVAMSAAVPGPFNPMPLPGIRFPCGEGADTRIVDGGVYDNLGLEAIDDLHGPCLIVLSAGGLFRTGWRGVLDHVPVLSSLKRAEALLYRQTTALRTRTMIERFKVWEATPPGQEPPPFARRGVLFGIASTLRAPERWTQGRPERLDGEDPIKLAQYKTTFNKIEPGVAEALMYRGWWLAGATLCTYHADLLAGDLPVWRELPPARVW